MIRTFATSQSEFLSSLEDNLERRIRSPSPSPSDQSCPRKRQRQSRHARLSPPLLTNRSPSANSIGTSVGQHYGVGDGDAIGNLFASYPQTFSTVPRPHGSRGLHEPRWKLRFDHEIHLSNDFLPQRRRRQHVRIPIPGPEAHPLPSTTPLSAPPLFRQAK
jgi:hypothetical protein